MNQWRCSAHLARGMRCWNPAMLALRMDEFPLCWPHYAKCLVDRSLKRRHDYQAPVRLVEPPARGQYR